MRDYDEARTAESEAHDRKALARAKLDAVKPAIYVDGRELSYKIGWAGGRAGDPKPDVDAMVELFREAGLQVPYLEPKPSPKTIQITRWEIPEEHCGRPVGDPVPWQEDPSSASDWWIQDRPRGGWTLYRVRHEDGTFDHVQNEITAGQFAKRFPDYEEPRPPCILKKGHSSDCAPDDFIAVLDVPSAEPVT